MISTLLQPIQYRNSFSDLKDFFSSYVLGKNFQLISYWFIPRGVLARQKA